jgi:2-C-methyl-D-erythritol 4-phosphate cytidylyltransferase
LKKTAIIVAGGNGSRMQIDLPKQFLELKGKPILMHSIACFTKYDAQIELILVIPASQIEKWKQLCDKHHFNINHQIVAGGETRFHSVKNGLEKSTGDLIAVHDGVRPLVSQETINNVFLEAEKSGAAIPCLEVSDTIRMMDKEGGSHTLERNTLKSIQTPQCFKQGWMKQAFDTEYQSIFTDCASVIEAAGFSVQLVKGNPENIKITIHQDLAIAKLLMS